MCVIVHVMHGKQPLAQGGYPVEIKVNNNNSERGSVISVCHVLGVQWFVECRYTETHHDESRGEVDRGGS